MTSYGIDIARSNTNKTVNNTCPIAIRLSNSVPFRVYFGRHFCREILQNTFVFFFYYYYHGLLRFVCICFLISNFLRLFVWFRQTRKYMKNIFENKIIKRNNAEKWRPHMAAWKIRDSMLENNEAPMTNWRFRRIISWIHTFIIHTLFINFNIIISICFAAVIILMKPFLNIFCSRVNNF